MITPSIHPESAAQHRRGLMFVFAAGVLWSTVGLGIRLIEDASVWQILFYRSISLTLLLYFVIRWRTGQDPFALVLMGSICLFTGDGFILSRYDGGIALGMGVFQVGAGLVLFTLGSRSLPAAELALLSLAEVVLGPVWVWLFLGETVGLNTLIGGGILLAAIAGNALSGIRRKPPPIITP